MKRSKTVPAVVAVFLLLTSAALAKAQCRKHSAEALAKKIAERFPAKTLSGMDQDRPLRGRVKVTIEHSLADDEDPQRFEIRRFSSLAHLEQWLKKRETDDLPHRFSMDLVNCAKGVCRFFTDGGINHNSLYLKRVTYGTSNGCPYLRSIYILDGD